MLENITYCEKCGKHESVAVLHKHHIKHRAAGGKDIEENVIKICWECHTLCHAGNISIGAQINIVATRMGKTPEEICEAIGLLSEKVLPAEYVFTGEENPLKGKSLEDVLQEYFNYEELGEQTLWEKAKILTGMVEAGWKIKTISSLVGCSPAIIRDRVRTYKAFPDEAMRAMDQTFTHHRIAAKTDSPAVWIDKVCEEGLSTRQLEEAIKGEGNTDLIIKDARREKAERAIRMVNELLSDTDETSEWLKKELGTLLGEESKIETKARDIAC